MTKEQVSTCCPEASVRVSFALILTKSHRSWFPSFCHNDRHSFPDQRIITTFHNMLPLSSKVICTEVLDIKKKKKKKPSGEPKFDFEYFTASEPALSLYTFGLN